MPMTTRLLTAITSLALLASVAPAAANAATAPVGRADLSTTALPTVNRSALCGKQCTVAQIAVKADGKFVLASPVAGKLSSWSFRSGTGASGDSYVLRVLRQNGTQFQAVASTPAVKVTDDGDTLRGPFTLPAPIQVKAGDKLGLQVLGGSAKSDQYDVPTIGSTAEDIYGPFYNPDLADGGPMRAPDFTSGGQQIPVQATIDVAAPTAPTAPSLTGLKLRPATFAAAKRGASAARKKRVRVGTTVSYTLSAAATTTFKVQRAVKGKRAGGKCVAAKRANRRKPNCTRYVSLRGSFARAGQAGRNQFRFTGRLRGRKLAAGRYRLAATAQNADGTSRTLRAAFRVIR